VRHEPTRDRGSASAELAVALPTLMLVIGFGMGAVSAVAAQLRCVDAAREAARAAARAEPAGTVRELAAETGPAGSQAEIRSTGDRVVVTVHAPVHLLGGMLPDVTVWGQAVGLREPGVP